MRARTFVALLIVTAVAVAAAAASIVSQPQPETVAGLGEPLFPDLLSQAQSGQVAALQVRKGAETITVALGPNGWGVKDRAGYPADLEVVRRTVSGLAKLTRKAAKTSRPENFDALGVSDAGPGASGTEVAILGPGGETLAKLLVGIPASTGGSGTFVRIPAEQRAWLADGSLAIPQEPKDWLDRTIVDIGENDILEIRSRFPDGSTLTAVRVAPGSEQFNILEIPTGKRLKHENFGASMAYALGQLELEDVVPRSEKPFPKAATQTMQVRTASGITYLIDLTEADGTVWVGVRAEAAKDGAAEARAQADAINARIAGWAYRVPEWKTQTLRRQVGELILPAS
jgi:hypothetical protein